MYRRELEIEGGAPSSADGPPPELHITGLWGSGNTVADEAKRFGRETVYSMWDGHALFGPGRPLTSLEKYPLLIAIIPLSEFLDRFGSLGGAACRVLEGDAIVGEGCDAVCAHSAQICSQPEVICEDQCPGWPRAITSCVSAASSCQEQSTCGAVIWQDKILPRFEDAGT